MSINSVRPTGNQFFNSVEESSVDFELAATATRVTQTTQPSLNVLNREIASASDRNGNFVAVWIENGVILANSTSVNMNWGTPIRLSLPNTTVSRPSVTMAVDGTSTATWAENNRVYKQSTKPLNGFWSLPVDAPIVKFIPCSFGDQ